MDKNKLYSPAMWKQVYFDDALYIRLKHELFKKAKGWKLKDKEEKQGSCYN